MCSEHERTLEELGGQLSAAKLAAAELREAADNAQLQQQQSLQEGAVTWANDRLVTQCKGCSREFNMTRRKVIKLFNCSHAFVIRPPTLSCRLTLSQYVLEAFRSFFLSLGESLPSSLFSFSSAFPNLFVEYPLRAKRALARLWARDTAARNCSIIPAVRKVSRVSLPRCEFLWRRISSRVAERDRTNEEKRAR